MQFALTSNSFCPLMSIASKAFVPLQRLEVLNSTSTIVHLEGLFLIVVQSHAQLRFWKLMALTARKAYVLLFALFIVIRLFCDWVFLKAACRPLYHSSWATSLQMLCKKWQCTRSESVPWVSTMQLKNPPCMSPPAQAEKTSSLSARDDQ